MIERVPVGLFNPYIGFQPVLLFSVLPLIPAFRNMWCLQFCMFLGFCSKTALFTVGVFLWSYLTFKFYVIPLHHDVRQGPNLPFTITLLSPIPAPKLLTSCHCRHTISGPIFPSLPSPRIISIFEPNLFSWQNTCLDFRQHPFFHFFLFASCHCSLSSYPLLSGDVFWHWFGLDQVWGSKSGAWAWWKEMPEAIDEWLDAREWYKKSHRVEKPDAS